MRSSAPAPIRLLVPLPPVAAFGVAAFLIGVAILLVALRPRTATLVASVPLLLAGIWMLAAGFWNEAHHADVSDAVGAQRRARQASLRRHPVLWLTVLPLLPGARAVERLETTQQHHGLVVVLIVGMGVWLLSVAVVAFRLQRARR